MTTLGVNVGDEFIREGILSFLDEILTSYRSFYVSKHDLKSLFETRLDEIERLADKFADSNVIIQAGAPVYWKNSGSACYSAEWVDELWRKRIFRLSAQKVVLNIGAGSGQAFAETSQSVSSDPKCAEFIREVHRACRWSSVRDPLASQILTDLGLDHVQLPCPALHAARRFKDSEASYGDIIGVNIMPLAGHYKLSEDVTPELASEFHQRLIPELRRYHRLVFVAHTQAEAEYMARFAAGGETIFYSPNYKDYFTVYSRCKGVFANRVHGAICAAGFGRPAGVVGNDSRLLIAHYVGVPFKYIASSDVDEIMTLFEERLTDERRERDRLLGLREESARQYINHLKAYF